MRIGLLVPTLNAGSLWPRWLATLATQTRQPDRTLVIDSSSSDDTVALAQAAGLEVRQISAAEFDHGATRQLGVEILADCDIIVCLTQDALLATPDALALLVQAFDDPAIAAAYGRQLAHEDATPIAAHVRSFNYPSQSRITTLADRHAYGLKAIFCSNSFAAWRRDALLACGGFPGRTLLAEDMLTCALLLQAGWKLAYVAEAEAYHSHNYGLLAEFRRYFDTGALHAHESWLLSAFGGASGEGMRFVRSEWQALRALGWYWPLRGLLGNAAKLAGYKLGRRYRWLPKAARTRLSMHPRWWRQDHPSAQ
ncbi:glycosyltransferase family 2 protein [Chitinimonas naiadis]